MAGKKSSTGSRIERYFVGVFEESRYQGNCPCCGEYISNHHLNRLSECQTCNWKPGIPIIRLLTHWPNYRQIRERSKSVFFKGIKISLVIAVLAALLSISTGGYKDANSVGELFESPGEDVYPYGSDLNNSKVESAFIDLLNGERRNRSLQPVGQRHELTQMGIAHSKDMAENKYLGHTEPDGDTIEDRYQSRHLLPECKLPTAHGGYYMGAENAYRVRNSESGYEAELAKEIFNSWMGSQGHREAMLVYSADQAGLGIAVEGETIYASLELC